ncbi:hypothetical protein ACHAW6_009946 [Cyclotella cf. meneghiniana]
MSSFPIKSMRQKIPAVEGRGIISSINPKLIILLVKITFVLLICGSSYLAGSLWGRHSLELHGAPLSVESLVRGGTARDAADSECKQTREKWIELRVQEELEQHKEYLLSGENMRDPNQFHSHTKRFPTSVERFATGIARVKKDDLDALFDFGNPVEKGAGTGNEDAIIIYNVRNAMPTSNKSLAHAIEYDDGKGIPLTDPRTATENCDGMNVIFTGNPEHTAQCTALIGNYESYHIQRWMRTDGGKIDHNLPLTHVSRGFAPRGKSNFYAPPYDGKNSQVKRHWKMLLTFLQNVDAVLEDLTPILKKVARNNAVVVMTCNHGQSALLMNFACSARRKSFDLGNVLVFPSDKETKELAEGLGLTTYYDEKNMGPLPSGGAKRYGDKYFTAMMYAKVICVLYPLMLNYDVLFQDVDVVYFKDPVVSHVYVNCGSVVHSDCNEPKIQHFDVLFQHDGSNTIRYAPYSANSGFYYVRANKRSQYLFTSLLYHSDLILTWDSHQQALVQLLAEHSSLFGLNVKVFSRDTEMFPGGYHFHNRHDFMKKFLQGKTDTYIFHMSWTDSFEHVMQRLLQLGEWYVEDKCIGSTASDILGSDGSLSLGDANLFEPCCAAEPIFSCHYKDKPSKLPCKDSITIDNTRKSFW